MLLGGSSRPPRRTHYSRRIRLTQTQHTFFNLQWDEGIYTSRRVCVAAAAGRFSSSVEFMKNREVDIFPRCNQVKHPQLLLSRKIETANFWQLKEQNVYLCIILWRRTSCPWTVESVWRWISQVYCLYDSFSVHRCFLKQSNLLVFRINRVPFGFWMSCAVSSDLISDHSSTKLQVLFGTSCSDAHPNIKAITILYEHDVARRVFVLHSSVRLPSPPSFTITALFHPEVSYFSLDIVTVFYLFI